MKNVFLLMTLYSPFDNKAATTYNKGDEYNFISIPDLVVGEKVPQADENYIMMPNGELKAISNIDSVLTNHDKILEIGLQQMKDDLEVDSYTKQVDENGNSIQSKLSDYLTTHSQMRDTYGAIFQKDSRYKLPFIQNCMRVTAVYMITEEKIDQLDSVISNDDNFMDTVREMREEAEKEITNELDMVNNLLASSLGDDHPPIEILSASYNGEEVEPEEITSRLAMHMLPDYLTQIDIRDTLEDEYIMETNLCVIKRSKGGDIQILSKK